MHKGKCPICKKTGNMTMHRVVEAPDETGDVSKIAMCQNCHDNQERYSNYLRDVCEIDINHEKILD